MRDIYQDVTDKIIAELEAGTAPWVRPWSGKIDPHPRNAVSQRHYRGINTLLLGMESALHGYASNQWLTFKQARDIGACVRKGEKACPVVFYKLLEVAEDAPAQVDDESAKAKRLPLLRQFHVFNVAQIEGLPERLQPTPATTTGVAWASCDLAERIMTASEADIRHEGLRAFYRRSDDCISLPEQASFVDAGGYYATALHELTHWTGHESRLDRQFGKRFGDSAYAAEELVAELGSAFLSAHCRIDGQLQHANYLDSWLQVLRNDKRAIFTAAAQAQKASDYLLLKAGLIEPEQPWPQAA